MSDEKAVIEIKPRDLSVQITDNAIAQLKVQRDQLKQFIKNALQKDIDYGTIPGTPKPTLYKAGAEKIAGVFILGSRIVSSKETIDHEKQFAMFSYTFEIYKLQTGEPISQCEGSANNKEKKYKNQDMYSILNTLQKMGQKRAFVGAVIVGVGASDYLTQDLEDMDPEDINGGSTKGRTNTDGGKAKPAQEKTVNKKTGEVRHDDFIFTFGQYRNRAISEIPNDRLASYAGYLKDLKNKSPMIIEAIEVMDLYLGMQGKQ